MALRVLLADESSTIKKVMQLALQDFGVEVKSVPIGLDVMQVAKSFQPDIIFADVLLSKRNGYEVAHDIKGDSVLRKTPVVLMWSGFMEIDEGKARSCGAEKRLEKPFDADHLRGLVKDLVPRLRENSISDYLSFPDLPEIVETPPHAFESEASGSADDDVVLDPPPSVPPPRAPGPKAPPPQAPRAAPPPPPPAASARPAGTGPAPSRPAAPSSGAPTRPAAPRAAAPPPAPEPTPISKITPPGSPETAFAGFVSLESDLEDPDDFQQVPLPGSKTQNFFERKDEEEWRQGGLEQFRVSPEEESSDYDHLEDLAEVPIATTDGVDEALGDLPEESPYHPNHVEERTPVPPPMASRTFGAALDASPAPSVAGLDPVRAEEVLREQVREVLESIAWKIIPDIAERVVREELQRLLKEAERMA